jgi:hypothetical protein
MRYVAMAVIALASIATTASYAADPPRLRTLQDLSKLPMSKIQRTLSCNPNQGLCCCDALGEVGCAGRDWCRNNGGSCVIFGCSR